MAVAVKFGTYDETAELAGMTVEEVREQYQEPWNIDPEAPALVNGKQVDDSCVLQDGDKVEFIKSETKWS